MSGSGQYYEHTAAYTPFFGFMGIVAAQVFCAFGAAYGTAKSAMGICAIGVQRPDLVMKSVIPVVMAGITAIYGLVVGIVLNQKVKSASQYSYREGFAHLAAGLTCGLCGLGSGYAIGLVGDAGVRGNAHQSKIFIVMILMLGFAGVLGMYGLIVALTLATGSG